jgi:hypothetical protein
MPSAALRVTCHEISTDLEIAAGGELDSQCQGQSACRRLHHIESCRCGLAILRAVTGRCLLGWQQQMLGDISMLLYRLSRCCHAWGCAADLRESPAANHWCNRRSDLLFEQLEAILGHSLEQMSRAGRIEQELILVSQISQKLQAIMQRQAQTPKPSHLEGGMRTQAHGPP